jgi:hypothetical protein
MSAIRGSMRQPMRLSQRTPFIRGSAATVQYLLDNLGAAAAYSLRKLRTTYGGSAIRVRRSSDNAEANIGFATAVQTRTNLAAIPINNNGGSTAPGVTMTTVGTGTEFGQPYVEVRWQGTASAAGFLQFAHGAMGAFNPAIHAPVTPGLTYTISIGFRLVSGTAPSGALFVRGEQFTNAGNFVEGIGVSLGPVTSTLQRGAVIEVAAATAAYVRPNIYMSVNNGEVVDVTIRFYTVNVEQAVGNARPLLQRNAPETVADIGDLDANALLAHVGLGNGFVTTWYDQSGNGLNATQTTAANQPRIVSNGVIETQNGRPALFFDGSTFFDHPISISGPSTFVAVASRSGVGSEAQSIFFATPPNTQLDNGMWSKVTTSINWGTYSDNFNSANADLTGALAVISTTSNSPPTGVIDMRTNGELLASSGAARYSGDVHDRRRIGSEHPASARFHIGWISELPVFSSALSTTDRQLLEHNQGEYYEITIS